MYVYSLTRLTGRRKNAERTTVVATVEVNRTTLIIVVISIAASVLPSVLVSLLLGPYAVLALFVPFLFVVAGLFLVDQRSRKGLQLRRFEAIRDAQKAKKHANEVFICGEPLAPPQVTVLVQNVVTNTNFGRQAQQVVAAPSIKRPAGATRESIFA